MDQALTKLTGRFSETAIDDEIVVMSLDSGDFFSLTGTARSIWQLIDGTRNRAALLNELARQYDCSPAEIENDCDAFVAQLSSAGLIGAA